MYTLRGDKKRKADNTNGNSGGSARCATTRGEPRRTACPNHVALGHRLCMSAPCSCATTVLSLRSLNCSEDVDRKLIEGSSRTQLVSNKL